MQRTLCLVGLLALAVASRATFTVATFSDPALDASTPLFTWDTTNSTLEGAWTGSGMTVETPGFTGGGSVTDAHFDMKPVQLTTLIAGTLYEMAAGQIVFYTNDINNPFFTVDFDGGLFLNPLSASAATQAGDLVDFSGPNVPANLIQEAFAFSLANPTQSGDKWTYTASFTSSADVVPEPASMVALGAGIAALVSRRRKA